MFAIIAKASVASLELKQALAWAWSKGLGFRVVSSIDKRGLQFK